MKIEWGKKIWQQQRLWTKEAQRRFMLLLLFFMLRNLIRTPLCVCACVCWTLRDTGETFWRAKRNYSKLNNNAKTARTKKILKSRSPITYREQYDEQVTKQATGSVGMPGFDSVKDCFFRFDRLYIVECVCVFVYFAHPKSNWIHCHLDQPTKLLVFVSAFVYVHVYVYNRAHSIVSMFGYVCMKVRRRNNVLMTFFVARLWIAFSEITL